MSGVCVCLAGQGLGSDEGCECAWVWVSECVSVCDIECMDM